MILRRLRRDLGRSSSRLSPRREDAKELQKDDRRPLGALCVKISQKNGPKTRKSRFLGRKSRFWGPKWPENGVFRRFFTIFNLRGPLRLVSVEDFMSETYAVTAGSTTNHANGANGEGGRPQMASLPEKSRVWLPFPIRDIRFIRSAGCSVLFPAYPCHRCNPWWIWAQNGVFRRFWTIFHLRGPLRLVSVEDFLSEAYPRNDKARVLYRAIRARRPRHRGMHEKKIAVFDLRTGLWLFACAGACARTPARTRGRDGKADGVL